MGTLYLAETTKYVNKEKFHNKKYCVINWMLLFNAQKNCLDTFIMKSVTMKAEIFYLPHSLKPNKNLPNAILSSYIIISCIKKKQTFPWVTKIMPTFTLLEMIPPNHCNERHLLVLGVQHGVCFEFWLPACFHAYRLISTSGLPHSGQTLTR